MLKWSIKITIGKWNSILCFGLVFLVLGSIVACTTVNPAVVDEEVTPPPPTKRASGIISCSKAKNYIGERKTVCGTVIDARYASTFDGKPTILNLCKTYPHPDRFNIVIWIQNRGKFPEPPEDYYKGKTICVTGVITQYKGTPQIDVKSPSQIQVK